MEDLAKKLSFATSAEFESELGVFPRIEKIKFAKAD